VTRPLTDLGVLDAAEAIRRGDVTSVGLVEACLERIAATDDALQAWVTVDATGARAAARERDADARSGRSLGPLAGVPIGLKDLIDVAGLPTTSGAASFAHTQPTRDAVLVARLRAAGAVILGKTVPTAFAYKDPAPTVNPWSVEHTPGGSSSGSAVAVAARQVPATIGTQTVGSILRPAAYCGVVGWKGTYGRVPLDGVVPLAWSLDHAGPITRSVLDAAVIDGVLADTPTTITSKERPTLGVSADLFDLAEPGLRRHLDDLVARLAEAGARIVDVTLPPSFETLMDAGRLVLEVEAATTHEVAFAIHEGDYPPAIAALVRAGLSRPATAYVQAQRVRAAYRAAVWPALASVDALLSPVAPGPAPRRTDGTGDFSLCAPWSFVGAPSISLPIGLDDAGLPLAIQLTGAPASDQGLLGAAAWVGGVIAFDARPATPGGRAAG
jgi:aspartyl-tRNA(Asn)/glutamyl-tRNA(Gln) amidotransferase subunit A